MWRSEAFILNTETTDDAYYLNIKQYYEWDYYGRPWILSFEHSPLFLLISQPFHCWIQTAHYEAITRFQTLYFHPTKHSFSVLPFDAYITDNHKDSFILLFQELYNAIRTRDTQTKTNQIKKNQTKRNQTKMNQTKMNQTKNKEKRVDENHPDKRSLSSKSSKATLDSFLLEGMEITALCTFPKGTSSKTIHQHPKYCQILDDMEQGKIDKSFVGTLQYKTKLWKITSQKQLDSEPSKSLFFQKPHTKKTSKLQEEQATCSKHVWVLDEKTQTCYPKGKVISHQTPYIINAIIKK